MAILRVSNQSQLDAAVRTAAGGDTIMLASGSYAKLQMSGFNKGAKVTVTSADAGNPAVINSMLLKSSSNIEVKNVELDYVASKSSSTPFVIENTRSVTINNVELDGHLSGYGQGIGLRVKGSQGVSVLNSEIFNFNNGMSFSNNSNVRVSNNDFRGIANDAMLVGSTKGGVIEGNDFRKMNSPDANRHKDMIQFFTSSVESPSSNIVIRNNVIDNPEVSHAIFFGNGLARAGNLSAFYRDIVIEDNYIRSAHVHGATMEHGSGVRILDNTIIAYSSSAKAINIPLINVSKSSINVTIQGNKVASVPDVQASWNISGNITGSKDLLHWSGSNATLRTSSGGTFSSLAAQEEPSAALGGETEVGGNGSRDAFRVLGNQRKDADFLIDDLSFSEGDTIMFQNFDEGAFVGRRGGNRLDLGDDGGSAKADSLADLQELVAMSGDVSARTSGDLLILEIAQGRDVDEVRIEGWGQEFRAEPDLF